MPSQMLLVVAKSSPSYSAPFIPPTINSGLVVKLKAGQLPSFEAFSTGGSHRKTGISLFVQRCTHSLQGPAGFILKVNVTTCDVNCAVLCCHKLCEMSDSESLVYFCWNV